MKKFIRINFHLSAWLSIIGGAVVLYEPSWTFPDPENILGPIRNNLVVVIGYLAVAQLLLWIFRYRKNGYVEALVMGILFPLVAGGMVYYSSAHFVPVSDILLFAMVYIGVSHFLYFFWGNKTLVEV